MTDDHGLLNSQQRKKAARRQRQLSEKQAGRTLDSVTTDAIQHALELSPAIAGGQSAVSVIPADAASLSEAKFVVKRINAALQVDEWLDAVRVWVWDGSAHRGTALSDVGRERGFEIRIEGVPR